MIGVAKITLNKISEKPILFLVTAIVSCTVFATYIILNEAEAVADDLHLVNVDQGLRGMDINPFTDTIYVANYLSNSITVLDGKTNQIKQTISLDDFYSGEGLYITGGAARVAVNPYYNLIYVTQRFLDSVSVIDGEKNIVIDSIPVQSGPWAITVNPNTNMVYTTNLFSNSVSVIDGNTNEVVATIPVGSGAWGIASNPFNNMVYVANSISNTVSVIDGYTNVLVDSIPIKIGPWGIDVNSFTNKVYVTGWDSNLVAIIDGATNKIEGTIQVGDGSWGISVNSLTNTIFVANEKDKTVTVIDGNTNTITDVLQSDIAPRAILVNPFTNQVYTTNLFSSSISVVNGDGGGSHNSVDTDSILQLLEQVQSGYDVDIGSSEPVSQIFTDTPLSYEATAETDLVTGIENIPKNNDDELLTNKPPKKDLDSEWLFSTLEALLLTHQEIHPQTLYTILKQVDLNNQIDLSDLEGTFLKINPNASVNSKVLVNELNRMIYNEQMFDGPELDIKAVAERLMEEYQNQYDGQTLDPDEIPSWFETMPVHFWYKQNSQEVIYL